MTIPSVDKASPAGNKSALLSDNSDSGACVYCYTNTESFVISKAFHLQF